MAVHALLWQELVELDASAASTEHAALRADLRRLIAIAPAEASPTCPNATAVETEACALRAFTVWRQDYARSQGVDLRYARSYSAR